MRRLCWALPLLLGACPDSVTSPGTAASVRPLHRCRSALHGHAVPMFHGDRARTGWDDDEPALVPDAVRRFAPAWDSPPFDHASAEGHDYPGRAYASPLYADDVPIAGGAYDGAIVSVVFSATSNGEVRATSAFAAACDDGALGGGETLWSRRVASPVVVPTLDNGAIDGKFPGIALGILSTPVLDLDSAPPRLYVVSQDADSARPGGAIWKAFALDARSGEVLPGWPVRLSEEAIEAANKNGPATFDPDARVVSQRAALALAPSGDRLYVAFGGYWDGAVGWIVALDTHSAGIAHAFSGARDDLHAKDGSLNRHANAGMWAPSGPAVGADGTVSMDTGNGPENEGAARTPHAWSNSYLAWSPDLDLRATYTPWDFCGLDRGDVDVGGSSPVLFPSPLLGRRLVTFGGKQGVVYLIDADRPGGTINARPPCSESPLDAARDTSLLPPTPSAPYCSGGSCVRGPLVVFGPPGDVASIDHAKGRTTPALFAGRDGQHYVFVTGSTKSAPASVDSVTPSVARLRVETGGAGPYLVEEAHDHELALLNPGSPVVTSHGGGDPIVWLLDPSAPRTEALLDPMIQPPVLYAVDGATLAVLFRSANLHVGGKYGTPVIAHGTVFVATDRVQAFAAPPSFLQ